MAEAVPRQGIKHKGQGWVIICNHKFGITMHASRRGLWQRCLRCKRYIQTIHIPDWPGEVLSQ